MLDLVGEYGLIPDLGAATAGAHALNQRLSDRSGIARLQQVLHHTLGGSPRSAPPSSTNSPAWVQRQSISTMSAAEVAAPTALLATYAMMALR